VRPLHPAASANPFVRERAALAEIAAGGPVVVVDDEDQENGGDLVFAAELAVPEPVAGLQVAVEQLVSVALVREFRRWGAGAVMWPGGTAGAVWAQAVSLRGLLLRPGRPPALDGVHVVPAAMGAGQGAGADAAVGDADTGDTAGEFQGDDAPG